MNIRVVLTALLVGAIYFIPQSLHFLRSGNPSLLLPENFDETTMAVLTSRAAGEHHGQPDPFRMQPATSGPDASHYAIQTFPPCFLSLLARIAGVPATTVFWAGSLVWPTLIAFLLAYIAYLCGLHDPLQLSLLVCLSLLVLPPPFWHIEGRYILQILAGRTPEFVLHLPYSRRFHPQFTGVLHYLTIAASLLSLKATKLGLRSFAAVLSGAAFGLTFYSYFFSWTILLGWFFLGSFLVWKWRRDAFRSWLIAPGIGLILSVPYWLWTLGRFGDLRTSVGFSNRHNVPVHLRPDLLVLLATICLLLLFLRSQHTRRELLWAPLVLNLAAAIGIVQNVVTGIYLAPFHYTHYFGRVTVSFACVSMLVLFAERMKWQASLRVAGWSLIALAVFCASVSQIRVYQWGSASTTLVLNALPALNYLKDRTAPGAIAFSPQPELHEALPLYTNAVPYYSGYWWPHEIGKDNALLERMAAMYVLQGTSLEEFARLVDSKPWQFFSHYIIASDLVSREQMRTAKSTLLGTFRRFLDAGVDARLTLPRYLLLSATTPLESTRFPHHALCRRIWSDERYSVFELTPR